MMKHRKPIFMVVLSALALGHTWAQQTQQNKCTEIENATFVDVFNGGNTTSGRITQGGILNGNTLTIFNSGAFPTPVSTTVSYSGDFTLTTNQGQLRALSVFLYDLGTGLFTVLAHIDPKLSTGRFAAATGVLYINGKTVGTAAPIKYPSNLSGEICFANQTADGEDSHE